MTAETTDTNIFIYRFEYIPPVKEADKERKISLFNGGNMENILENYRLFLGVQHRKTNTITRYLDSAKKLLQFTRDINQQNIQRYIAHLNQHYGQNTVTSQIIGLNKFLDYLGRNDLHVKTPRWKNITRDVATINEIQKLIQHTKEHYSYMNYLMVLFIRDLDTRNHEITKARWDWIHGDKILFKDCKTGDTTGTLTQELIEALGHWKTITRNPDSPFIFTQQKGRYQGDKLSDKGGTIREFINKASLSCLGRRLNPQDLRASIMTAEYSMFVNPKIIQMKARHRSEQTTMRYNHVDEMLLTQYIESGTIFSENKQVLCKPTLKKNENKPYDIYTFSASQDSLNQEIDNNSFSFSFSFFLSEDHPTTFFKDGVCVNTGDNKMFSHILSFIYASILVSPFTQNNQASFLRNVSFTHGQGDTGQTSLFCITFFISSQVINFIPCLQMVQPPVFQQASLAWSGERASSERNIGRSTILVRSGHWSKTGVLQW